ncbi:MAG: T9SS type A sorting domain-containing protein [bacterium]|nr:T9SS type A sorting domain-containing protein [bacterium]
MHHNLIYRNTAVRRGAGIFIYDCTPTFTNNTIVYNTCTDSAYSVGGGIHVDIGDSYRGTNNIIYFNQAHSSPQISGSSENMYTCCPVALPGPGNITADPQFADTTIDDFNLAEGSPCIDAGDPVSPLDPDNTRADMGALYFDRSTLPVVISLIPTNPPIQIPPAGGNFTFDLTVSNQSGSPLPCDLWFSVQLPDSSWYSPIVGPINRTLSPGAILSRHYHQRVPQNAPAGFYLYEARVGVYPDSIWDRSSFTFEKVVGRWSLVVGEEKNGSSFRRDRNQTTFLLGWDNWCEESDSDLGAHGMRPSGSGANPTIAVMPNPFNPSTTIRFDLPQAAQVRLQVYDINGRCVWAQHAAPLQAGSHEITFDGSGLAAGVYIYHLILSGSETNSTQLSGKMVLLK